MENGWLNLGGVGMRLCGRVGLLVRKGKKKKEGSTAQQVETLS